MTDQPTIEITKEAYKKASPEVKQEVDLHMKFKSYERIKKLDEKIDNTVINCDKKFATKGQIKALWSVLFAVLMAVLAAGDVIADFVSKLKG